MSRENLIHIKLEHDEAIESRKDVLTTEADLIKIAQAIRTTVDNKVLGYKMNYTDLQAALGRVQLSRQPEFQKRRFDIASYYSDRIKKFNSNIRIQQDILNPYHSRHLYLIELPLEHIKKSRNMIIEEMRKKGVGATIHYKPVHQMSYYAQYHQQPLPITEYIADRIMTLPIGGHMTLKNAEYIMDVFENVMA